MPDFNFSLIDETDYRIRVHEAASKLLATGSVGLFAASAQAAFSPDLASLLEPQLSKAFAKIRENPLPEGDDFHQRINSVLNLAALNPHLAIAEVQQVGRLKLAHSIWRIIKPSAGRPPLRSIRIKREKNDRSWKNFAKEETILEGLLFGFRCAWTVNLFAAWPYATLLFPEHAHPREQFLEYRDFLLAWEIVRRTRIASLRVLYNSIWAFSSLNCVHLQLGCFEGGLPIESFEAIDYPLFHPFVTEDREEAWAKIDALQDLQMPFNLMFAKSKSGRPSCYVLPRVGENLGPGESGDPATSVPVVPTTGIAAAELCGWWVANRRGALVMEDDLIKAGQSVCLTAGKAA